MTFNIRKNVSLKPYNTFDIDISAELFADIESVEDLRKVLLENEGKELLILGGGSNILFTKDFSGLVLKMNLKGITLVHEDEESVSLKVMAGENWHEFVLYTLEHNWGGVENLSLIPGSVGASPIQNIGAYGVEAKDTIQTVEVVDIATGQMMMFSHSDCEFGYRDSYFKREGRGKYIITAVTFQLSKDPKPNVEYRSLKDLFEDRLKDVWGPALSIQEVSDAVIKIRQSKLPDPKYYGNAGSFFKNPIVERTKLQPLLYKYKTVPFYPIDEKRVKIPAGWLVEKAEWKGVRHGDVGVHEDQALVLINYDKATGNEVRAFSEKIMKDVEMKFGIQLEREVNVL